MLLTELKWIAIVKKPVIIYSFQTCMTFSLLQNTDSKECYFLKISSVVPQKKESKACLEQQ